MEVISRGGTTAQIDPLRFCGWLLERIKERGVQVRNPARALSVSKDTDGALNAVRISQDGEEIECEFRYTLSSEEAKANSISAVYAPRHHFWRMVASRLQYPLSYSIDKNTSERAGRTLATRAQPTLQT